MVFETSADVQTLLAKVTQEEEQLQTQLMAVEKRARRTYNIYVSISLFLVMASILLIFAEAPFLVRTTSTLFLLLSLIGIGYNKYKYVATSRSLDSHIQSLQEEKVQLGQKLSELLNEENRCVFHESFKVAGTSYQQDYLEQLLAQGQIDFTNQVQLLPKSTSEEDEQEIQIYIQDGLVGYVPQTLTERLSRYLYNGRYFLSGRAKIYENQHGSHEKTHIGVEVELKLLEKHA